MRVTVRLSGSLAQRIGPRRVLELDEPVTVGDVLAALARDASLGIDSTRSLAAVAGGAVVSSEHELSDGDELDVLVPVAGG